ncbi:VOC family protein [Streptomyces sp. MNU89]|uniref:VOC family protein n=1 Tax=Streptomyces sp. MNU89 TaxID=2560025 RepID=UPI001E54A875|nr:VOC family protein [Streptomyces sp. MNU89]MCC9738066.1 VOC family protein [Streptomyces sp. MNU89]
MRNSRDAFHIAVPARDLDAAALFYNKMLGCPVARRYADRITFDFFGDQLVCHYSPDDPVVESPTLYPRHFGVTFREREDFDALLRLVNLRKVPVFQEVRSRFGGTVEEHSTVVLVDPTGNLLEFKHYADPRMMY